MRPPATSRLGRIVTGLGPRRLAQTYGPLFDAPATRRVFGGRLGARVAPVALPVVILVLMRHEGRSLASVGLVLAAYTLGSAVGQTVSASLLGRVAARGLLLSCAVANIVLLAGALALLETNASVALIAAGFAAAAFAEPPVGSVIRVFWEHVHGAQLAQTAFSLEVASSAAIYVAAPLLAGVALAIVSPETCFAMLAVLSALAGVLHARSLPGDMTFGDTAPDAEAAVTPRASGDWRPLLPVFFVAGGWSAAFSVFLFVLSATIADLGRPSLASTAVALSALGGMLAAAWHGHVIQRWSPRPQLVAAMTIFGSALALFALLTEQSALVIVVAGIGVGLTTSPPLTLSDVWVMERARAAIKARAYAVLNLALLVASALGSLAAGLLAHDVSEQTAVTIAAAVCLVCALAAQFATGARRAAALPERSG
jgi:predicted MFS family arabinose efflux permease